ncbi:hypothetical protein R5W23_005809 [Gemmata sp. JC673]|uniref:Uncharacterized protein n=1 Tax=Gemmata algarum TaxID=2975278 RepID=A0ABU5EUL6_9BACT|nr:hypothetical protein [Gemmata algarum]MDY3558668.1 hypothetical protein [Gemmata algarum]
MNRTAKAFSVLLGGLAGGAACAEPPAMPAAVPGAAPAAPALPNTAGPVRVRLADVVHADYRDAVMSVVNKPTVSTKATAPDLICTATMYEWLFDHPDRVALAWQRLKVPAVPITDAGNGLFSWTDEHGSEVVWRTVGTFRDGRVWYATGKVKPGPATPSVPVKAVAVLSHPQKAAKDGVASFSTSVQLFLVSDSRAANLALRLLGPAAPRVAEQGAEQFLEFFNGVANYVQKNPTKADALLAPPGKK